MNPSLKVSLAALLATSAALSGARGEAPLNTAVEVVDYVPGNHGTLFDWVSGDPFTNALSALGSPTIDTTGDGGDIDVDEQAPVVPLYPPFRAHELVVVGVGGHIVLKFGEPVMDDPMNPYGLDFIVYGNAWYGIGNDQPWINRDPNAVALGSGFAQARGLVSVSQDGETWFAFSEGPFSGTFASTLGREYDPAQADPSLGEWNAWWGAPTDPSFPVDPSVAASNLTGRTVAEVARLYRGSAGGVGFDLAGLDLDIHPDTGHKWIQFVRIEPAGEINVQVSIKLDALVATRPVPPFRHWQNRHFSWLEHLEEEQPLADPGANGTPNLLAYALGEDPWTTEPTTAFTVDWEPSASPPSLAVSYLRNAAATDVSVQIQGAPSPAGPWSADGIVQEDEVEPAAEGLERVTARVPMDQSYGFFRMKVELR